MRPFRASICRTGGQSSNGMDIIHDVIILDLAIMISGYRDMLVESILSIKLSSSGIVFIWTQGTNYKV